MSTFNLDIGTRVIIYGAGQLGKQYFGSLKDVYEIVAFFDINADKIKEVNGIPVYNPFKTNYLKNVVVIICLHNAIMHTEVAERLHEYGYNKIVFIPTESKFLNYFDEMQMIYTNIEEGSFIQKHIPEYQIMSEYKPKESVIRKSNEHVVVNIDIELIYIGRGKQVDQIKKRYSQECSDAYIKAYDKFDEYANKPVTILEPYSKLFYSFMNGKENLDEYILMCKPIQNMEAISEESFIEDRFRVFSVLEQKFQNGIEEFYKSPIEVEWNKRGFFETIDGHHRAIFLFCKGVKYIPSRMKIEDYEKWINRTVAHDFLDFIESLKIRNFCTHIPNPIFSKLPYRREFSSKNILTKLMAFIGLKSLKNISFLDLSDYNSYFARNFYRMGAKTSASIESDYVKWNIAMNLNKLLFTTDVNVELLNNKFEFTGIYDIAFITETLTMENKEKALSRLNKKIRKMLIWEYNPMSHTKEYIMSCSKFTYYRKLMECCTEGKFNEVGIFCIDANFEF